LKHIESQIDIAAPRHTVWAELTAFTGFGEWNPFLPHLEAELATGSPFKATGRLPVGIKLRFVGEITSVIPETELAWRAHPTLLPPSAFDVVHTFTLSETGGQTRLLQREEVSGWMMPLSGWILRQAQSGQEQMNQALRERVVA
jgi:hypothetical protein